MKRAITLVAALGGALLPAAALAQTDTSLIQTPLPIEYDRGRNVSVVEQSRPDYDALGIRAGGVLIYPRIDFGLGFSNNVYLTDGGEESDGYASIAPSLRVRTDWSRHQIIVNGGARLRRYFSNSPRNQNEWNINALGRLDVGNAFTVTAEGQAARVQEDPFSGQTASTLATLSSYRRTFAGLRGEYREGRVRAQVGYNHQTFDFNSIELDDGIRFDQSDRDRDIDQVSGRFEYALSPSAAVYGQVDYNDTEYSQRLAPGSLDRDSTGYRALAGLSLDLSGFFRGIAAIGYTHRDYDSMALGDVSGVSAEARLEYFRSELTTFTLGLRRVIEDSNLGNTGAFFDNYASLRVDHELLRNLLLNAEIDYGIQDYIDSPQRSRTLRGRGGARLLLSRSLAAGADLSYGSRRLRGFGFESNINEFEAGVSLTLQR